MDNSFRNSVRQRARNRCEYCRLHQEHFPFAPFHIEHVVPKKHGGSDALTNLALACQHCNLHKGSNLTGLDPESGEIAVLFNPRTQRWHDHFAFRGMMIVGLTPTGRATVRVFEMNSVGRLQLRAELAAIRETG